MESSLLECPDSFVEVIDYLTYHNMYHASQILQDAIPPEENLEMPWKKYRHVYHRIRLAILETSVNSPNSPLHNMAFSILKHLTLLYFKKKTDEYLEFVKKLAYFKLLYHFRKEEFNLDHLKSDINELFEGVTLDGPDIEDTEYPLEDLSHVDIGEINSQFQDLLQKIDLTKGTKIQINSLDKRTKKIIDDLNKKYNPNELREELRLFLAPIKESFGKPFIHYVNEDIRKGIYRPDSIDPNLAHGIPKELRNAKANPIDLIDALEGSKKEEFLNYLINLGITIPPHPLNQPFTNHHQQPQQQEQQSFVEGHMLTNEHHMGNVLDGPDGNVIEGDEYTADPSMLGVHQNDQLKRKNRSKKADEMMGTLTKLQKK